MTFVCNTLDDAIEIAWVINPDDPLPVLKRLVTLNAARSKAWACHRRAAKYDDAYYRRQIGRWLEDLEQLEQFLAKETK